MGEKFLFWSDLHDEVSPFDIPEPAGPRPDAILLAGDIGSSGGNVALMVRIHDLWGVPVIAINGNHEPYTAKRFDKHLKREAADLAAARASGRDITIHRRGVSLIGNTRIICATLWTDMRLYPEKFPAVLSTVGDRDRGMNDYRHVGWFDESRGVYRKMIPQDTVTMHKADKGFILSELGKPFEGKTIVMTHHVPVAEKMHGELRGRRRGVDAAYVSDLWEEIGQFPVDAWISGHDHFQRDLVMEGRHGPVTFLSNCHGYPSEVTAYDPYVILDSDAPWAAIRDDYPEEPLPEDERAPDDGPSF